MSARDRREDSESSSRRGDALGMDLGESEERPRPRARIASLRAPERPRRVGPRRIKDEGRCWRCANLRDGGACVVLAVSWRPRFRRRPRLYPRLPASMTAAFGNLRLCRNELARRRAFDAGRTAFLINAGRTGSRDPQPGAEGAHLRPTAFSLGSHDIFAIADSQELVASDFAASGLAVSILRELRRLAIRGRRSTVSGEFTGQRSSTRRRPRLIEVAADGKPIRSVASSDRLG